jgi:hypothetical protein
VLIFGSCVNSYDTVEGPPSPAFRGSILSFPTTGPTLTTWHRSALGVRHNTDFIQRFTEREAQRRGVKRKVPLTATQRAARREILRQIYFLTPADAECTQVNIAGMLRKWKRWTSFPSMAGTIANQEQDIASLPS